MTVFQRIRGVFVGVLMLVFAVILIVNPSDDIYMLLIIILALGLVISGIKDIIFYFTMARHMVGGKMILIQGVIVLDFGILTGSLSNVPKFYVLLYLIGVHAFSGVVETLRALESKRAVDGPWKLKLSHGIVNFLLAAACLIFIKHADTALIIYGIGLVYSAVMRILTAFRRTAFMVIE